MIGLSLSFRRFVFVKLFYHFLATFPLLWGWLFLFYTCFLMRTLNVLLHWIRIHFRDPNLLIYQIDWLIFLYTSQIVKTIPNFLFISDFFDENGKVIIFFLYYENACQKLILTLFLLLNLFSTIHELLHQHQINHTISMWVSYSVFSAFLLAYFLL